MNKTSTNARRLFGPSVDTARGLIVVLQKLSCALQKGGKTSETLELANSADYELMLGDQSDETFSLANGLEAADGWALIARYGDHPHPGLKDQKKPIIQRFNQEIAGQLVANFKQGMGRIRRAVVGLPIFNGHPDVKGYETMFPDKRVYGTFADLEARSDGFYGKPILTNDGSRLVEDGKDRLSPTWLGQKIGETRDGVTIVAPFRLKSVGLVELGNIPGPSLMNSAPKTSTTSPMNPKELLIQLLVALGYEAPNGISDDDLTSLAQQAVRECAEDETANADISELKKQHKTIAAQRRVLIADRKTLANAKTTLETETVTLSNAKTALEGEKVTLTNAKTVAEQERDTLKTNFAAERKERCMLLVNTAVAEGRIPAAQRDAEVVTLCNASDFPAALATLAAKKKTIKTASVTAHLSAGRAEGGDRMGKIIELVNIRMAKNGEDYTTAYIAVQTDKENAALFAQMKKPEQAVN
jgi:hypothetical protein